MYIYLDHNASTPVAPNVIEAMAAAMRKHFANPSSSDHMAGASAAQEIETARELIAHDVGARSAEIIFTSGATEANGLAIRGAFHAQQSQGRHRIVTAATEHPSVLRTAEALVREGAELIVLPVGTDGRLNLGDVAEAVDGRTALVSIMAANNETGVLQSVAAIGKLCREHDALFHSDLTQLAGHAFIDVGSLGIHLGSLSAHKMYGPKGVGALYARAPRPRARLATQQTGGGQEKGLRSGTLNTEGIVGFGEAFRLRRRQLQDIDILRARRDRLEKRLLEIPGASRNGDAVARLPHTLNLSIDGIDPHALQHALRNQVLFSTSSACSTDKVEASSVLLAMYGDGPRARNGFRLGLGYGTTDDDVERAAEAFRKAALRIRSGVLSGG